MDLPRSVFYGVRCARCEADYYFSDKSRIEIMISFSFADKGMIPPYIKTKIGLVVGFGFENYPHECTPRLIG